MTTNNLIAYKQSKDHQYVHVIEESKVTFSDNESSVGTLIITDHAGSFEPEEWNFIVPTVMGEGVYHSAYFPVTLYPNQKGETE